MSTKTEDITVKQGDFGYRLRLPLFDADEAARTDLTGYTPELKVWPPGDTDGALTLTGDNGWIDEDTGIAYYDVADGDFDTKAQYLYEVEVTKDGAEESAKSGRFIVEESP